VLGNRLLIGRLGSFDGTRMPGFAAEKPRQRPGRRRREILWRGTGDGSPRSPGENGGACTIRFSTANGNRGGVPKTEIRRVLNSVTC